MDFLGAGLLPLFVVGADAGVEEGEELAANVFANRLLNAGAGPFCPVGLLLLFAVDDGVLDVESGIVGPL